MSRRANMTGLSLVLALASANLLAAQERPVEALILSPDPGERVFSDGVLVAVSFIDPGARIDPTSIALVVDGRDVTAEAEIGSDLVTWQPREPLAPGPREARLTFRSRDGDAMDPVVWTFSVSSGTVRRAAPTPFETGDVRDPAARHRGTVTVESTAQSASGAGAALRRDESFVPRIGVDATGELADGWRYSARVRMSGYESSTRQPMNRYRLDLRSPYLNASVGDVNPLLQGVMLAGRRVRGVQADLGVNGPVRLTMVAGQTRRAIDGLINPTDSTRVARSGIYSQNLIAVRPAVGRGDRFQFGLTFLRVRDDTASIAPLQAHAPEPGGFAQPANPSPKDNLVLGSDVMVRALNGRVLLRYENAVSFLANDISGGAITSAELESLFAEYGYDPISIDPSRFERLFIINASMIPLDPRGLTNRAHQVRGTANIGGHILSAEWYSIGGSYHTLGYPALPRDRRGVRLRDAVSLLDHALFISTGIERDQDNLDGLRPHTTTTLSWFADASWHPSPDALSLAGSVRLGGRSSDAPAGQPGAVDERIVSLSAGAGYPVRLIDGWRTRLLLNLSHIDRDDPSNPELGSRNVYALTGVQAEAHAGGTRSTILYGLNRSTLTGFDNATTDFHRIAASGRHPVAQNWIGLVDGSFTAARSPDEAGAFGMRYDRFELLGGGEFDWAGHSFVALTAGMVRYVDGVDGGRDTRELVAYFRVRRAF